MRKELGIILVLLLVAALCAARAQGQVVLYFTAASCGPCIQQKPDTDRLAAEKLIQVVDADREPDLVQRVRVRGTPELVALDANRNVVARLSGGPRSEAELRAFAVKYGKQGWQSAGLQEPAWRQFNPPGSVNGRGMIQDVLSRLDAQGRQTMYDPDPITYCHEGTHWLHSMIRNQFPGGTGAHNAFYVGEGRCIVFREPKCTIDQAAQFVPAQLRTHSLFRTYFVDSRSDWNQSPLYILDEWCAYVNGAQAAQESGNPRGSDAPFAHVFVHYAAAVIEAIKRHDPNYPELATLENFAAWQEQRLNNLAASKSVSCACCPVVGQGVIRRILNATGRIVVRPVPSSPTGPTGTLSPPMQPQQPWQPPTVEQNPGPPVDRPQPQVPDQSAWDAWEQRQDAKLANVRNELTVLIQNSQCNCDPQAMANLQASLTQTNNRITTITNQLNQLQPAGGQSTATASPVFYDIRPRKKVGD